jgi:hypothetical protein
VEHQKRIESYFRLIFRLICLIFRLICWLPLYVICEFSEQYGCLSRPTQALGVSFAHILFGYVFVDVKSGLLRARVCVIPV